MRSAVLFAALLLAACPKTGPGGPGDGPGSDAGPHGGTGGTVDVGCGRDEDCGAGLVCDLETRQCKAGLDCTQNASVCDFCGDPAADCGFGTSPAYCSADAGVCRRQQGECGACSDDVQCAPAASGLPSKCEDGFCAAGCGACPAGFTCNGGGCVPAAGSSACDGALPCDPAGGGGCPDGQTCTALGVCLSLCASDADCPAGRICDQQPGPTEQQCVAACPLGDHVNQNGVDLVCHADGRYGAPCPTPDATDGCPAGTVCGDDGVCRRSGCQTSADCPLIRTTCDVASGTCVDGCSSDADCGAFELCTGGQCQAQGCRGKDVSCDLGQWCCGTEAFADASTCPAGVSDGSCFLAPDPWCRPCQSNDDCADIAQSPYAGGKPSFCFELKQNDQSIGKFCSVGCSSNADCPRGLACQQDLPTDQDGVTTSGCLDTLCAGIAASR